MSASLAEEVYDAVEHGQMKRAVELIDNHVASERNITNEMRRINQGLCNQLRDSQQRTKALLEYARHMPTCRMPANTCNCGLKELIEELE